MVAVGVAALVIKKSKPLVKQVGEGLVKLGEELKKCGEEAPVPPVQPEPERAKTEEPAPVTDEEPEAEATKTEAAQAGPANVEPEKKEVRPKVKKAAKGSA